MMPAMVGTHELILIALVVLLLFGASKIPQLMRGLGSGISEFKKGIKEGERADAPPAQPPPPPPAAEKH